MWRLVRPLAQQARSAVKGGKYFRCSGGVLALTTVRQKVPLDPRSSHSEEEEKAAEAAAAKEGKMPASCGPENPDDEEDEMENMFVQGPAGMEWGGPTRGGQRPEPTRYGDWERKGRASDW
jgi:hypothetical protein